ncbi:ester cyclase [Roseibium sp. SCP14]|uniref:ester cyclase n=1 Tax=Roseibium sp. SCP14 TaxID=3141375 RepID=UPI0033365A8C
MSNLDIFASERLDAEHLRHSYEEQERRLTQFLLKVWNSGELDFIDRLVDSAYTLHHDPGDPWEGQTLTREGLKDRVRKSRAPFPDQTFDIQEMISSRDRTAIAWTWCGTHGKDFGHFKASGQRLTMSGMTLYYFREGLLCGHWQMVDRLSIYQQLMANAGHGTQ